MVNGVKFFEHWFDEISFENEDPKPATNPDLINLPHSPERIKVYRERFLRGEAIFHPDDF